MARFLSAEWFDELDRVAPAGGTGAGPGQARPLANQVVTATPDGEVRYQVVVSDAGVGVRRLAPGVPPPGSAPLTFTSDYTTASAIARGELSAQTALLEGHLRVAGNSTGMSEDLAQLAGTDLVPAGVRATTTY
ncbi:MAG: SCP2 sterol-binding domain-containing protein [Acidimicrobiales bacterium]